jgi:hypothetical protein
MTEQHRYALIKIAQIISAASSSGIFGGFRAFENCAIALNMPFLLQWE